MIDDRSVTAGLLTRDDLHMLGGSLARAWPVERSSSFAALLEAMDEAQAKMSTAVPEGTDHGERPGG